MARRWGGCGRGSNVLGHPLNALAWLANARSRAGHGLAAGELISTGNCADVIRLGPGQTAEARFGPLGQVSLRLRA